MPFAPVLPHTDGEKADETEVHKAYRAFVSANLDIRKENGLWRIKKMIRGQDRYLTDRELILLSKSVERCNG
jgi:hypothetical protein